MFWPLPPMSRVWVQYILIGRRSKLTSVHGSAPFRTPSSSSSLAFVQLDPAPAATRIVGVSAAWRKLLTQAEMAAPHLHVATIEGEHGSGKHTLARYLFRHSRLAGAGFQRRDAREWLATDGDPTTLAGFTYLDRVDLLLPPGQGLLLGILKSLEDRPSAHAVVLASSQTSLRQMAGQGLMLPDLAFRLTAIRFAVPPLRERREDIASLAQFLLDRICTRYQQRPVVLGPGALTRLLQHSWPGNVRELASVLEAALLEASNGIIRPADLALPDASQTRYNPQFGTGPDAYTASRPTDLSLDAIIRHHVQYVLDLNRGNKLRTARQLSISRSTLYRILANDNLLTG
jgi:DNA-binding NtrC family response regulator